jgi:hypothetical protein
MWNAEFGMRSGVRRIMAKRRVVTVRRREFKKPTASANQGTAGRARHGEFRATGSGTRALIAPCFLLPRPLQCFLVLGLASRAQNGACEE